MVSTVLEIFHFNDRLKVEGSGKGVHFRAEGLSLRHSSNWPRPLSPLGERLAQRLPTLVENGQAGAVPDGVFLSYEQIQELSGEDAELFDSLCPWSPLSIELLSFGALGSPDFRIRTRFLFGNVEVDALRIGAFLRFRGTVYRLPESAHNMLQLIDDLNRWSPERKSNRQEVLLRWSEIRTVADSADAQLDRYLSEENVVAPECVHLDLSADDSGRVSVVPTFDGVSETSLHKEYLRFGKVQDIYDLSESGGARLRVVIRPEVHRALDKVKRFRRLSEREKDRILSNPALLLGDDPEASVADLLHFGSRVKGIDQYPARIQAFILRFGPRVKGIGEYPAHIQAFIASGEKWKDLGKEEQREGSPVRAGLEWTDYEGERKALLFKGKEEIQQLLDELQSAQVAQKPVVEYQGVKLPVESELLASLHDLLLELQDQGKKGDKPKSQRRRTGVLIYENIERVEHSEGSPEEGGNSQSNFTRPLALLPDVNLKNHQLEGIGWLQQSLQQPGTKGVLLADDMGLGKTLQALAFLAWVMEWQRKETLGRDSAPYNPILIVAPLILIDEVGWRAEIDRFFKSSHFMPYQVLYGKELKQLRREQGTEATLSRPLLDIEAIRCNRLVITNYETVTNYALTFAMIPWSIVVADEAHTFKDPNTRITYTMKALKAEFRVAMTGTPIQNRMLDLWNLVDFLQPGPLLGSAKEFQAQYERRSKGEEEAEKATEQLQQRLRMNRNNAVLLRRTKKEHLPGLPHKHERTIPCPLTPEQRQLHVSFIQRAQTGNGRGSAFSLLSSLNRLCQHPALLNKEGLVADNPATLMAASHKLQAVINQLQEIRGRGEKALIFAWFRDAQEILRKVIENEFKLNVHVVNGQAQGAGSKMLAARTRMIKDFEEQVGFNVLILSPEVAGVGLTIVKANHVLHYGRWWNPAVEDQATDRVYRIGQERDVEVYYFVATDPLGKFMTFDEHLHSLISRKRRSAQDFLEPQDDAETLQSELFRKVQADSGASNEVVVAPSISTPHAVAALSPSEFEALVAAMFEAEGYQIILTPYANDRGIDAIGIHEKEVLFVQCKHSQDGRSFDHSAIDEVAYGETYYTSQLLPGTLRERRPSLVVVANGEANSQSHREAEQRGIQLLTGRALFRRLANAKVTRVLLDHMEGGRAKSPDSVKSRLQEIIDRSTT